MAGENNYEEWKEIRARADSVANTAFLIAGGALSLSITVILGNKKALELSDESKSLTIEAWYFLFTSIVLFLSLKILLIAQAMTLQFNSRFVDRHLTKLNASSWLVGGLAFSTFVYGLFIMVQAATFAITT